MLDVEMTLRHHKQTLTTAIRVSIQGGTDKCWEAKKLFDRLNAAGDLNLDTGGKTDATKWIRCYVQQPPWREKISKQGRRFIAVLCKTGIPREAFTADYGGNKKFEVYIRTGTRPKLLGEWTETEGYGIQAQTLSTSPCKLGEDALLAELRA